MSKFLKWTVGLPIVLIGFIPMYLGLFYLALIMKIRHGQSINFTDALNGSLEGIKEAFLDAKEI